MSAKRILHRPLRDAILFSLGEIFRGGWPADKVIQRQMKANRKWGSHDRRLFAESVYDLVRWWRRILFALEVPWPEADRWTDDAPEVLAKAVGFWMALKEVAPGKGAEASEDFTGALARWNSEDGPRAVRASLPNWLDQWGFEQFGPRWEALLPALNSTAPVYLRANLLKTTSQKLLQQLRSEGFSVEPESEAALRLGQRTNVFVSEVFKKGWFEIQDLHSQEVAKALQVEPGLRVVDACAGGGGKSLHLAALMGNKGKIISMDVVERKLEQLRERANRAGASIIETKLIDSTKAIKRLEESADRVLLDVPCSGLGVLRRNPDAKWKLKPEEIARLREIQSDILGRYSKMCRKGGMLVYATCSIMPDENEKQIENFLSQHGTEFELLEQRSLPLEVDGADGFFIARLKRLS